jgi:biopolymer transport protein ExbD
MAIGSFNTQAYPAPMAEINTTPLVDVMLVLLIIFMITAPLLTHSVEIELPYAKSTPMAQKPVTLQVSIDADNQILVDSTAVDRSSLEETFRQAVARDARAEMHLHADRATRYESVAETMSAARRAGLERIGFVTRPGTEGSR